MKIVALAFATSLAVSAAAAQTVQPYYPQPWGLQTRPPVYTPPPVPTYLPPVYNPAPVYVPPMPVMPVPFVVPSAGIVCHQIGPTTICN